jgi:hypothetical protein
MEWERSMITTTYVPRVTVYGDRPAHTVDIADALAECEDPNRNVVLMLGAMRPGYLGREMVTVDDLRRWIHEQEDAEAWLAISDGERAMTEMGLLR